MKLSHIDFKIFLMMVFFSLLILIRTDSVADKLTTSNNDKASLSMQIIGDQELPQVLYIIPWKDRALPSIVGVKTEVVSLIFYNPCLFLKSKSVTNGQSIEDWRCLVK